jgi:dynein heavy chain
MLEEATKVLKELKKDDLYVLNSLNTPTPNVVKVMELSCHMFQLKPGKGNLGKMTNDTHGFFHLSKQNLLNNPNAFIKNMIDYDKEHIPDSVVKKVKLIIDNSEFSLEAVKASSEALLGICKWAMAMVKYYELLKIVNPKRAKVAEMTEKLKKVQAELDVKRKMLAAVQEKLDRLEAKMAEM